MDTVLIAGCGDVGTALGLRLAAAGRRVLGLRRDPSRLPEPIEPVAADLARPESLAGIPAPVDEVVYAAAADAPTEAAYRAAYVDGLANLARALAGAARPPRRLVLVSSTGVYGQHAGEWVDEDSPAEPARFTGRALLEGEALAGRGPWRAVVVRLGGIYGPGRERLVRRVEAGEPCAGDPPRYTNRIHRDDAAGALAHVLSLDEPAPCYLGVDHEPAPECEVMDWIAARLGRPRPPRARGAAAGTGPGSKRCSNARLVASGYRFLYPTFRDGYAPLLSGRRG